MANKWTALAVTTIGVLMVSLDTRIMILGLPQIANSLGADAEQAIWFTQAFQLVLTVSLLFAGRLSDMVGRVKLYMVGTALFTVGSGLTALAQSPLQVIAFRALQGLGGGILISTSVALITDVTPGDELGFAVSINQVAVRFGGIVGLTVSGIVLSLLDWRALFYMNVPIGIFEVFWVRHRLREMFKPEGRAVIDWAGLVTFTISVATFLLALTFAGYGPGQDTIVLSLIVLSLVSLAIFVRNERRTQNPILDLGLFKVREFTGGAIAMLLNATAFGSSLLLISLYFQLVQGLSPLSAGLAIIPFEVAFLMVAPISGRLSGKHGHLPFTTTGLVLTSVSMFLLSGAGRSTPYGYLVVALALLGAGIGSFSAPNTSSVMNAVPATRRGVASGVRSTFFNLGYASSLNLVIVIMTFTIPYSIVTSVISLGGASLPPAYVDSFAQALRNVFLCFAVLNSFALVPSIFRRSRTREKPSSSAQGKED